MLRHCCIASHCIAVKDGAPHVAAAPHHSFEKSWARANVRCLCFYCSAFSIFLFENHHSITEIRVPHFMRFLSIYLSLSDHQENETRHWKRVGQGGKNPLNVALGSALLLCFSISGLFFFFFCLTTCTRETQRRFTESDGWNCPSSFFGLFLG
jgi:hypothetical protein